MRPHESKKRNVFGVAPSPFNGIKLELGIVIIVGMVLIIGIDSITHDTLIQIGLLFIAGTSAMVWIIWRTRRILKRQNHNQIESDSSDDKM
jgi:hypothetical protein